jgi:hypothetical protein
VFQLHHPHLLPSQDVQPASSVQPHLPRIDNPNRPAVWQPDHHLESRLLDGDDVDIVALACSRDQNSLSTPDSSEAAPRRPSDSRFQPRSLDYGGSVGETTRS